MASNDVVKAASEAGDLKQEAFKAFTPNIKALCVAASLFALITVAQVLAARVAHSQALLMDCISMGVDALTYLGNIFVECLKRDGSEHIPAQLVVTAISLSCLTYFTYAAAAEGWDTVQICRGNAPAQGAGVAVNGYITLVFALGGVIFDVICLFAFYRSHKKVGDSRALNMFTALLHVGADCLRSTSTLVMSVLILHGGFDSMCVDAYTCLLIGATIMCAAVVGFFKWVKMMVKLIRRLCGVEAVTTAQGLGEDEDATKARGP